MVIGGLVGQSVMEMYINREYDKKNGNIGLRTTLPGAVKFDALWRSGRSKDCRKAYKDAWLSPRQMLELYFSKGAEIVKAVLFKQFGEEALKVRAEYEAIYGEELGINYGIITYPQNEEMWGSLYKVVECYEMVKVPVTIEYVLTEDGEKITIPSDLKTPEEKIAWLNRNVPGWIPDQIFSDTEEEDIQFKTVICPSLSQNLILAFGPTEIQCGRLQFFPWSAARVNGEWGGIVDLIKDAQKNINYWESLITYKIQIEGGGGAQFADESEFFDEKEFYNYAQNRNNPKKVFRLKKGALQKNPNGPAVPVSKSPFPAEAMQHLQHMIEVVLPRISKVTPASQGRAENSNESGYLFRLKKLQSDIEQYVIYESLRNFWNEVGEAYLYQAARTYGNKVERTFFNNATKTSFTINKHETRIDENGNKFDVIVNDFSKLREIRHRVQVTESEDSPTRKVEIMQVSSSLISSMPPEKSLTKMELAHTLAKQLDTFDEEKKQLLEMYHQKEMELAFISMDVQIAEAQVRIANAKAQMEALKNGTAGGQVNQTGGTSQPNGNQPPVKQKQPLQLSPAPGTMSGQSIPTPLSADTNTVNTMQNQGELVTA
jgi:hypothetical protein